ncbi:MAG: CHAT domain-containing protein [Caldilineaceae bacterium]|nr:CHAT domain-containing protein [Caldilineaceae bacterium]MBP8107349.1 CHAT domain-containing protein [Caldilineaceae bacterium]MBP8122625.1 CHAT domain-containing protein [Caldilineaceae bacterium]MBP9071187.1 CHAT domain-containing protein [Caldilineaceae bacterium]
MASRTKILFFASNPDSVKPLNLDEEIRAIRAKIRASDYRDVLDLVACLAVRPDDLLQELNTERPAIVHFSGHGTGSGELVLMDDNRQPKPVSTGALKALFATLKDNIQVVVLNACATQPQAEAITESIDCVIGMSGDLGDRAALIFAASFYRAIGFARTVQEAFDQGKVALLLDGIAEEKTPVLLHRPGVDPSTVRLVNPWDSEADVVGTNLEVARAILGLHATVAAAQPARKEQVADYYGKIANTLKEVVAALRVNQFPHGNCAKMQFYGQELPDTIGDLIGMAKAQKLSAMLQHAYNVESIHTSLPNIADREGSLADLEKAAAYFEVAADSLLASI